MLIDVICLRKNGTPVLCFKTGFSISILRVELAINSPAVTCEHREHRAREKSSSASIGIDAFGMCSRNRSR